MNRIARGFGAAAIALFALAAVRDAVDDWIDATVLPPLVTEQSVEVLDRNGQLLRAYTVADGRWRLAVTLDQVDSGFVEMLIRFEDKRFRDHHGVDLVAMTRAVGQALWNRHVVSGGSTLTMQVARLLEDSGTGRWTGKLRQIRVALALERRLSKDQILTLYLNRAPYGGNLEGIRAATLAYFGKPPRRLTPAQSALLVALPQSPEARRPDRSPETATTARDRVLARMRDDGLLDDNTIRAAETESVQPGRASLPALAAHLADRVRSADPSAGTITLSLDAVLQGQLESLALDAASGRSDRVQVAIMVADYRSGEVLASVGSAAYQADARAGFVDMTKALRSPGSTLKPLIYGLAFDQGLVHPETLIADRPTSFGGYAPQNFDGLFRGELRVRTALQLSLNIPAVSLTEALGPQHLISGLRRAGADPVVPGGRPGLAVALGGVGMTLEDLMRLYGAIANGGKSIDLRGNSVAPPGFVPARVVGEVAAWEVADILLEVPRPVGVKGTGIAFKTGTSYGHRDAWAIGFDGRHVIGVWMGRADGTPIPGAFGGELAAPVLFASFERLKSRIDPIAPPPAATLLVTTAQLPQPLQRFRQPGEVVASDGPQIDFPPDGALIEGTGLFARVRDGVAPFTWLANGAPIATTHDRQVELRDLGPGYSSITVIDGAGLAAQARVELR